MEQKLDFLEGLQMLVEDLDVPNDDRDKSAQGHSGSVNSKCTGHVRTKKNRHDVDNTHGISCWLGFLQESLSLTIFQQLWCELIY